MKLEYVLTSCNLNHLYCDFIPVFIRAWKKFNTRNKDSNSISSGKYTRKIYKIF